MSSNVTAATPSADRPGFFDDFSDPALARYYEITPGIGNVIRRGDGLHYEIARAPDGPASAADCLSIDSLGRPQSPTAKVLFRFTGTEWTLEACVEYDFRPKRNGRTAYVWLVQGGTEERYGESLALIRGADLDPGSHSLTLLVHARSDEPRTIELTRTADDKYWLRVTRSASRVTVSWSLDGRVFETVLERAVLSQSSEQTLVINSSSFAGGASFVLRALRLSGTRPDPAPQRPPVFAAGGSEKAEVSAADIVAALKAARDIDLRACAVAGTLDLGQVTSPIASNIRMQDCRFTASFVASNLVRLTGALSCLNCEFAAVGLSNVEFDGPLSMVGCRFTADTRFIDTQFRGGANFSGCVFSERPFFRVAHAFRPVSFYHADFLSGADLSSATFDDLSLSDIRVEEGSLTLYRSEVAGTLRLIATLQREPQPLGRELEFSAARFGSLIISAGSRLNRGEYTGPARWDLATNVYLRRATVDSLELYNVHFGVLDLSGATLRSKDIDTATFTEVVGGWPVETEFYSCFISYSSKDAAFASRLRAELQKSGVRCWFAPEDIKIGEEFRQTIDDAIREYDKLLLVLSENSVRSSWVQDEVEACLERERRQQRQVLFPIRLDAAITRTRHAWAAAIRRRRHIGDFTRWRDSEAYEQAFQRLIRDLKAQNVPK